MSEGPAGNDRAAPVPAPAPVTVVGYPDHVPVSVGQTVPGLASVKIALTSLRALSIVTLVLVLVLAAASIVGIVSLRSQVSALSERVAELSTQQSARADVPVAADEPATALQSQVAQLPPAPELPEGVVVPGGVDASGAIVIGDPQAANVVEVYVDYQCPYCQRWEQEIGEVLAQKAQDPSSDLVIKQYNLAFLGETSPTLEPPGSSARAASAALCVLEGEGPAAFASFNARIFAIADPNRSSVQFQAPELAQLAADAGASAPTIACIESEPHVPFVALSTQNGFARGVQGTPTVIVNGRTLDNSFADAELLSLLG